MTGIAVELKPALAAAHNNHGRALEHNDKLEAALASYKRALNHSGQQGYVDAFCAKVYLEHFLCAWDTLDTDMHIVAANLRRNLEPQHAAAEPCVQPFRAFAYPLPPDLFMAVTGKVVAQERARLPHHLTRTGGKRGGGGGGEGGGGCLRSRGWRLRCCLRWRVQRGGGRGCAWVICRPTSADIP